MTTHHHSRLWGRGGRGLCLVGLLVAAACQSESPAADSGNGGDMKPVPGMSDKTPGGPMSGSMNMMPAGGGTSAQFKFCNGVSSDRGPVELELSVGNMKWKASSGACVPASGQSCASIPAGLARVSFTMGGKEVFAQDVGFEGGQQYLMVATVDRSSQKIGLGGGKLGTGANCASANPFPGGLAPGPDGPAAIGKFCHSVGLANNAGGVEFELRLGDTRLTASSNGCSIPMGQTCGGLPTGSVTAALYHEGAMVASKPVTIDSGNEYLFGVSLDGSNNPVITQNTLGRGECVSAGPKPAMPPPGGDNTIGIKFCNRLDDGDAELTVGALTLLAKPGQCAPVKGMPCGRVMAGPTTISLAVDGEDVGMAMRNLPAGSDIAFVLKDDGTGTGTATLMSGAIPAGMCSTYEPM